MTFLGRLFGETVDPHLKRAGELVESAHGNAVAMFIPLQDRFPLLQKTEIGRWDFILTVAGVFMAASRLRNLRLEHTREDQLMEVVADRLNHWNPGAIRGFEDCKGLFDREAHRLIEAGHESRFVASDAVGIWIVWNVLNHLPQTKEEFLLVRASGGMVTHAFFNWWGE